MRTRPTVPLPLVVAFAAALSLGADCDDDPTGIEAEADFEASLTGAAERPNPVTTSAVGSAFFDVQGSTVRFRIEVENIQNVTAAHIHVGGTAVAGPIVVTLFEAGTSRPSFTARGVLAESTFTQADIEAVGGIATLDQLLTAMAAGGTYVNVHTTQNPAGEIRGQVEES
jgi:hypothetical protein